MDNHTIKHSAKGLGTDAQQMTVNIRVSGGENMNGKNI
jgi:hypothetical protein